VIQSIDLQVQLTAWLIPIHIPTTISSNEAIAVGSSDWLKNSARQLNLKQYALKNEKLEDENSYIHYLTGKN